MDFLRSHVTSTDSMSITDKGKIHLVRCKRFLNMLKTYSFSVFVKCDNKGTGKV